MYTVQLNLLPPQFEVVRAHICLPAILLAFSRVIAVVFFTEDKISSGNVVVYPCCFISSIFKFPSKCNELRKLAK